MPPVPINPSAFIFPFSARPLLLPGRNLYGSCTAPTLMGGCGCPRTTQGNYPPRGWSGTRMAFSFPSDAPPDSLPGRLWPGGASWRREAAHRLCTKVVAVGRLLLGAAPPPSPPAPCPGDFGQEARAGEERQRTATPSAWRAACSRSAAVSCVGPGMVPSNGSSCPRRRRAASELRPSRLWTATRLRVVPVVRVLVGGAACARRSQGHPATLRV